MINLAQFKGKPAKFGGSHYVLIPANVMKYEDIDDNTLLSIAIKKVVVDEDL